MTQPVERAAGGPYAGRTLVIVNPQAGHDSLPRLLRQLGGAFAERRAPIDIVETIRPAHATEIARDGAMLGYRAVCMVGGDGTLAEVTSGLAGTACPVAIIPRGTANQVALNLGIPLDLEGAVEVAVNGATTHMDLGRVGDRSFALVAGAGFDAAVMAGATRELKERWGFAAYVIAAMRHALAATPLDFRVTADGKVINIRAVSVMIANMGELFTGFLPFSFSLSPTTRSWQDGLLEVVIVAPLTLPDVGMVLWRSARSQFAGDDRLIHLRAREVTIEADPPIAVQIDGDPAGVTPMHAAVADAGVNVLVPRRP